MVKTRDNMQALGVPCIFPAYLNAPRSGRECRDQRGDPISADFRHDHRLCGDAGDYVAADLG